MVDNNQGLRSVNGNASAPPYTAGPYTWDQQVTFSQGVSGVNTPDDVWYVNNGLAASGNGKGWATAFITIAEAVAAAGAGDTIFVQASSTNYSEDVVITANRISLFGIGFGNEVGGWQPAAQNGTILTLSGAKGSRVSGFNFRGNGTTCKAIDISEIVSNDSDSIVIDHNLFKGTVQDPGYHIFANGCPAYVKIYNNHFTWGVIAIGCTHAGFTSATGWEIVNNYFSDKISTAGIYMPLRRSLIKGNHFSTIGISISTIGYSATNGDYNDVNDNYVVGTWNTVGEAQTNDSWQGNYNNFAVNAANPT